MPVSQGFDAVLAGVLGLLIGSFLNVVIYRTPVMMYREWLSDAVANLMTSKDVPSLWSLVFGPKATPPEGLEAAADKAAVAIEKLPPFDLTRPASRCGACGHKIRWYQNIPVLSYLFLRGRCASCKTSISPRYPLVELVTGALFALCGWRFGITPTGALWAAFAALLICQFLIDFDTQFLPDSLNYTLLWLGLIGAAMGWTGVPLSSAVWGAVFGYLSLWLVYHAYRLVTGKEGMGYGDFKLLAALGVWLGADYLIAIILVSSLVGAVIGLTLRFVGKLAHKDIPIAFGPFLAGAGLVCLVIGPELVRQWVPFAFPLGALLH
ncbi:leader peptidase (prepilin peptidase)/N-methyltransferase [Variovorax boronicumulans]|uniref:prepilin peptidase n=1 Tax=Variovorax TaxID=34072 RepID=UPI002789E8BA|nr:A24 family peptidase [Variovorax boronicumulans]MDP9990270.1 leader peptidase (prepilin peptidase)/N-methyltransferase [Variovorax boronicumulans]MDQ0001221.1 leader peptidase (prepilin peptidase)/N-methyltransferase [Variovorax boronicumulans]